MSLCRVNYHLQNTVNLTQTKSYLIATKFVEKYKTWHVLHDILSDWDTKYFGRDKKHSGDIHSPLGRYKKLYKD